MSGEIRKDEAAADARRFAVAEELRERSFAAVENAQKAMKRAQRVRAKAAELTAKQPPRRKRG